MIEALKTLVESALEGLGFTVVTGYGMTLENFKERSAFEKPAAFISDDGFNDNHSRDYSAVEQLFTIWLVAEEDSDIEVYSSTLFNGLQYQTITENDSERIVQVKSGRKSSQTIEIAVEVA